MKSMLNCMLFLISITHHNCLILAKVSWIFNLKCYRILVNWTGGVPDNKDERKPLPSMCEEEEPDEDSLLKKINAILSK